MRFKTESNWIIHDLLHSNFQMRLTATTCHAGRPQNFAIAFTKTPRLL